MNREKKIELLVTLSEARTMWRDLTVQLQLNQQELQKKPGDVFALTAINNITNDLKALETVIETSGMKILKEWEVEFKVEFKFMKQANQKNEPENQLKLV